MDVAKIVAVLLNNDVALRDLLRLSYRQTVPALQQRVGAYADGE